MTRVLYLVDTDWVIHYLNGRGQIVDRIKALIKDGLAVSIISLAELYEGVYYLRILQVMKGRLPTSYPESPF
jgi:predicted nucleic acid-binding protein